jgi:hypothetical protein
MGGVIDKILGIEVDKVSINCWCCNKKSKSEGQQSDMEEKTSSYNQNRRRGGSSISDRFRRRYSRSKIINQSWVIILNYIG